VTLCIGIIFSVSESLQPILFLIGQNSRCYSDLFFWSRNSYNDNFNLTKVKEVMEGVGNDFKNMTWESHWVINCDDVTVPILFHFDFDTRNELFLDCESWNYEKPGRGEIYVANSFAKAYGVFFYVSKITFENILYLAESRRYDGGSCLLLY
jgi:hypothetical protein